MSLSEIWAKVDALEAHDHEKYKREIAAFSREEMREIFKDWRLYRRALVWILEVDQNTGKFNPTRWRPRPWQLAYEGFPSTSNVEHIKRSNFDLFLKSRKTGCTTDVETEMYARAAAQQHFKGMFISFEEQVAKDTGQILKTAHHYNPYKPKLDKDNDSEMVFSVTKSSIAIRTAGSKVLGRGLNLNLLHMTEVAHFFKAVDDVPSFMAGVLDALARGGRCVFETTPNGEDPIFYSSWKAKGELWQNLFLSVFTDETVDWPADHPEVLASTANETFEYSEYEHGLINAGANRGHIRFLRYEKQKLNDKSIAHPTSSHIEGDEKMLLQEYPVDEDSCFLSSAETVFEPQIVQMLKLRAQSPLWNLDGGKLRVWEKPMVGKPYVIFADTSEGLPTSDYQAAAVLDVNKLKYVAQLRGRWEKWQDYARALDELGRWFNEALLMVERNNHGHVILHILENDLVYPNMFFMDESVFTEQERIGWKTDQITKPIMVAEFKEALEAGALDINDVDALHEIGQYRLVTQKTSRSQDKYKAPSGENDDLVIAYMGAFQGRDFAYIQTNAKTVNYGSFGTQ